MSQSMKNKRPKSRRRRRSLRRNFRSYRATTKTPFKQGEIVIIDDVTEKGSHLKIKAVRRWWFQIICLPLAHLAYRLLN